MTATATAAGTGTWQQLGASGTARQEVSYVAVGGKFYLAGGGTLHQVYDPATDSWSTLAPLPEGRDHIESVVVGGQIYYIGGLTSYPDGVTGRVDIYDPATNSFTTGAPMPRPRGAGGIAAHGGKIYYAGGLQKPLGALTASASQWLDVYDPATDTWQQLPDMPTARDHFHAAVVDGRLYAIGGRDSTQGLAEAGLRNVNEVYDIAAGTWSSGGGALPTARSGFAAAAVGEEIYFLGGEGPATTGAYTDVEAFNTRTGAWRTLASMPRPRHGIQAATCNGGIYVAAGARQPGGGSPVDDHDVFFPGGVKTTCGSRYRVNAGGAALPGSGSALGWEGDSAGSPSPYVNGGSATASTGQAVDVTDPSIPPGTPEAVFQTERYDSPADPEMSWSFPVTPGRYEVRLHFSENHPPAQQDHIRVFHVDIEGDRKLTLFDTYKEAGAGYKGITRSFEVDANGVLNIDFVHKAQNPAIKGIEIIPAGERARELSSVPRVRNFGAIIVGQTRTNTVRLFNNGAIGDPVVTISGAAVTGADAADFSLDTAGLDPTLAPGESTTVTTTFSAATPGNRAATLRVIHDGVGSPFEVPMRGEATTDVPVGFGKSVLAGTGYNLGTSLAWGPDGRLYLATIDGTIKAFTVARAGPNDYVVTDAETIELITTIPNHEDADGVLSPSAEGRLVTGLLVTGTASSPVLYVTSSDPRIGGGEGPANKTGLDTNSGVLSRLTRTGGIWAKADLVRGFPRSEENHASNGMALSADGNTLYIAQGGNTNKGAPSNNFALLPEYALSAAVLSVDLTAISGPYDLPTLKNTSPPWGGRSGANQAKLVPGGPVQVYAAGFRNPYDLVLTSRGLYTVDNGSNGGWGDTPAGANTPGCTNAVQEGGISDPDSLHRVTPGYFGGHPNPTRGNTANTFGGLSPVTVSDVAQCNYVNATANPSVLATFGSSTDGLAEYRSAKFGGAMQGDLIAAGYAFDEIYRLKLNAAGTAVESKTTLFSNVGLDPLDVTAMADDGAFPGTIWATQLVGGNIIVFEPNTTACSGADDETLDEDEDGYANSVEIDNGTDPCSGADVPPDADGDKTPDRADDDDDDDGIPDLDDPFAVDRANGTTRTVPFDLEFDNGVNDGGLLNLGFTGLMKNGTTDYLDQFLLGNLVRRGAGGLLTVESVPAGTARGGGNTQLYGFQLGVAIGTGGPPVLARTRLVSPFASLTAQAGQSMGLQLGTGDQDDFVMVAVAGTASGGLRVEFAKEVAGIVSDEREVALPPGPSAVDLALRIDPLAKTVVPQFAVVTGGVAGPLTSIGEPAPIPPGWLSGATAPAIGFIATNGGAAAFPANWDFLRIRQATGDPGPAPVPGASPFPATPTPTPTPTPTANRPAAAPRLSGLRVSPASFRAAKRGGTVVSTGGSLIRFNLSRAAIVQFRVQQARTGVMRSSKCLAVTTQRRSGRRCTRWVLLPGSFSHRGQAGASSLRFSGRLAGRQLPPGRHRLTATPVAGGGYGATARVSITIRR